MIMVMTMMIDDVCRSEVYSSSYIECRGEKKFNTLISSKINIRLGGEAGGVVGLVKFLTQEKNHPVTTPPTTNPTTHSPLTPSPPKNKDLFFKFELVLPNCSPSTPECPFEVANREGATLAVLRVLVYALVENVFVA
jgi:hypothetical protein